jgi:NAD(P)-dependent dehydrogenase (short-subunit alcohol dehydrogenase family)
MSRFEGKVAIVTGAASGVGRATTQRLTSEGATVFGLDLNEDGLKETFDGLERGAYAVSDISRRDAAHDAVAQCVAANGRVDVLCNIAGVLRSGRLANVTEDDLSLIIGVNVAGTLWMTQAAMPHLEEAGGAVVNIGSNAGLMGVAYQTAYAASKGAVIQMTRSLAMEFIKSGVRINCVAPGGIKTPMSKTAQLPEDADWELIQPYVGFRPMSRPEELAAVIAFVASDDASAMHGAIVSADSGLTTG